MAKYRKILVAYDGSDSARNALRQACRLARADQSWIKVLAVVPAYTGDLELIGVSNIKETMLGPGQKLLAEAKMIADDEDVRILSNLEQGEPYERIVNVAEDEGCDLIIMGRKGRSRIERDLIGGVTARVIGHTVKDVLVIPDQSSISWGKILLASDGSPYSKAAEDLSLELAKERNAVLCAVSVAYTNDEFSALAPEAVRELAEKAEERVADIKKRGEAMGVTVTTWVKEGEPYEAITALAAETDATVIVMGSHGRKGLTRLLMGSVTEHVVGLASCPVLVSHLK
ncbi:MAG: universal stress protein [Thermodesulfobacteriota bacterium]